MDHDEPNGAPALRKLRRKRLTTAGRLLAIVTDDGTLDIADLAQRLRVPAPRLCACRDGSGTLEPELQLLLAALLVELSPQHGPLARRLYAQAQSALRTRRDVADTHLTYPAWRWRLDGP